MEVGFIFLGPSSEVWRRGVDGVLYFSCTKKIINSRIVGKGGRIGGEREKVDREVQTSHKMLCGTCRVTRGGDFLVNSVLLLLEGPIISSLHREFPVNSMPDSPQGLKKEEVGKNFQSSEVSYSLRKGPTVARIPL